MIVIAFGALLALTSYNCVYAADINTLVFSPDSKPYGLTYGEWTAKWWQWIFSIPQQNNPLTDSSGNNCPIKQTGPVWFLAGTAGGKAERWCTIPSGSAILAPIMNSECSFLDFPSAKTTPDLIACAKADNDRTINLKATVDGQQLTNLGAYRVLSLSNVTISPDNVYGAPFGNTTMVSDGFWLFLKPLPVGQHTLQFGGLTPGNPTTGTNNFAVDVTYHITVK
jgi:hypothetical protein